MAERKREKSRRKSTSTPARRTASKTAKARSAASTTRERRRTPPLPAPEPVVHRPPISPKDHYAREKARRADRRAAMADPLEEARLAFQQMLAKEAEAQRGGRPKGSRTRGGAKTAGPDAAESDE